MGGVAASALLGPTDDAMRAKTPGFSFSNRSPLAKGLIQAYAVGFLVCRGFAKLMPWVVTHDMVDIIRITNAPVVRSASVKTGQCLRDIPLAQVQALLEVAHAAHNADLWIITLVWINPRINGRSALHVKDPAGCAVVSRIVVAQIGFLLGNGDGQVRVNALSERFNPDPRFNLVAAPGRLA